jgi:hypothetical protein
MEAGNVSKYQFICSPKFFQPFFFVNAITDGDGGIEITAQSCLALYQDRFIKRGVCKSRSYLRLLLFECCVPIRC